MKTDNKISIETQLEYMLSNLLSEDPDITDVTVNFKIRKSNEPNIGRIEIDLSDTDKNEIFDLYIC